MALSALDRDEIRRLHGGIGMSPTPGVEGHYDLTPDQRIGLVCLPDLIIEIRPKVPMSSVLFLVSYACDAATWTSRHADFSDDVDLTEVLAVMLARLVEQATGRGLLNGYRCEDEALQAPRGRIRFDEQIRRRLGAAAPIEVSHDIFTPDVLENRLLVAGLLAMNKVLLRSGRVRAELSRAQGLFGGVTRRHFRSAEVPDVVFTRLNRHYLPALQLAILVLRSSSLELGAGTTKGMAFLIDMNKAFEQFLRKALREELRGPLEAARMSFPDLPPEVHLDEAGRVGLRPDLCLLDPDQRIAWVGDAKYKRLPSGAYRHADRTRCWRISWPCTCQEAHWSTLRTKARVSANTE